MASLILVIFSANVVGGALAKNKSLTKMYKSPHFGSREVKVSYLLGCSEPAIDGFDYGIEER